MALVLAAAALIAPGAAIAQAWPAKPVRVVVGFAPGGAADFVARALSEPMSRALGQPLVVENRPGAGSSIAAEFVARASPDGHTLLIASPSSISVNPALNPKLGYNPVTDFTPIAKLTASPLVVAVSPSAGIATMRDLSSVPATLAAVDRLRSAGVRVAGCVLSGVSDSGTGNAKRFPA